MPPFSNAHNRRVDWIGYRVRGVTAAGVAVGLAGAVATGPV